MPDGLDQINVTTRRYIRTTPALVDGVFNQDPLNFMLRQNLKEDWNGGSSINENFIYDTQHGGAYAKGKTFNVTQKQTEQQMRWDPKYMQVSVPLYMEDIRVLNKGGLAAVKLLKSRVDQAYMSLGAFVSIATYLPGTGAGYTANISGLAEAISDGVAASWNGVVYPTYGQCTRALYNGAISSPAPTDLAGGALEYDTLDAAYYAVFFGSGDYEPNVVITTARGFSLLKAKFQTQQRFQDTKLEAPVGFRGMTFNGATVLASRYCPGSHLTNPAGAGTNDPIAVEYLKETSNGAIVAYPQGGLTATTGESLFILNARKEFLHYYVDTDPIFGGGFRDFIPAGNNTILVGQVLLAHQLTLHPRYHNSLFDFAS